ncbi:hypothetical protein LCGC14_0387260 [marine sediment metagenome]|uniref:Uncharacterized protein n=1 Tax=marine sediment metagenome TaxID=412755 RepID=A0A0F9W9R6_9ZZZZ
MQTVNGVEMIAATDKGPEWNSVFGVSGAAFKSADASSTVAVTDAPTSGKKLVITDIYIGTDTAMLIEIEEETSGTIFFSIPAAANAWIPVITRSKLKLPTADKKLHVNTDGAGNISVSAFYFSEA